MIEVRRDLTLPCVYDSDPHAAIALAELYEQTVGYELPGAGIMHDQQTENDSIVSVHARHGELLMEAAGLCAPHINKPTQQRPGSITLEDAYTAPHVDDHSSHTEAYVLMILRLFTADKRNGARALLANARPGLFRIPGDSEVYRYYPDEDAYGIPLAEAEKRGYGPHRFVNPSQMLDSLERNDFDPLVVEPNIYFFDQHPFSSVFCRGLSLIGPSSVHGFISMDEGLPRNVRYSDFHIRSQTL